MFSGHKEQNNIILKVHVMYLQVVRYVLMKKYITVSYVQ
jgi:hypothetical protein